MNFISQQTPRLSGETEPVPALCWVTVNEGRFWADGWAVRWFPPSGRLFVAAPEGGRWCKGGAEGRLLLKLTHILLLRPWVLLSGSVGWICRSFHRPLISKWVCGQGRLRWGRNTGLSGSTRGEVHWHLWDLVHISEGRFGIFWKFLRRKYLFDTDAECKF